MPVVVDFIKYYIVLLLLLVQPQRGLLQRKTLLTVDVGIDGTERGKTKKPLFFFSSFGP